MLLKMLLIILKNNKQNLQLYKFFIKLCVEYVFNFPSCTAFITNFLHVMIAIHIITNGFLSKPSHNIKIKNIKLED